MIQRLGYSFRLYLLYFILVGGLAWFLVHKALDTLNSSVSQSAEEVMVDTANLLAEFIGRNSLKDALYLDEIREIVPQYLDRRVNARIYSVLKIKPDLQIYVTDHRGIVRFDSKGLSEGEDFSNWRDVWHTLRGRYAARSSPIDPWIETALPDEKAHYVAAPIINKGEIIGVVTVSKAVRSLAPVLTAADNTLTGYAILLFVVSLIFGAIITWLLALSIKRLVAYADDLGQGKKVKPPVIKEREFNRLAHAMENMQEQLEGKKYVESYIHTLAHEMKSPLTSIQGAVELLAEEMPKEQRDRFISNIESSAQRMTSFVERLLALAAVEKRKELENVEHFNLYQSVKYLIEARRPQVKTSGVRINNTIDPTIKVKAEKFLLEQALGNLLDNALDFSVEGSEVTLEAEHLDNQVTIKVIDQGSGIPQYAKNRLFERFFSTPRPDTKERSTGLGLSFIKEVAELHHGTITLENRTQGGVLAQITIPQ